MYMYMYLHVHCTMYSTSYTCNHNHKMCSITKSAHTCTQKYMCIAHYIAKVVVDGEKKEPTNIHTRTVYIHVHVGTVYIYTCTRA